MRIQRDPQKQQPPVSQYPEAKRNQKVNCAVKSRRRFAVVPGEYGYPQRLLEMSNSLEERTPFGLDTFTLLNALRKLTPKIRLYRCSELDDMVIGPPPPNNGPW